MTTAQLVRRIESLERSTAPITDIKNVSTMEKARRILFAIRQGVEAKKTLEEAGASMSQDRRAELTGRLEAARRICALLAKYGPTNEMQPNEGDLEWR